jgi:hypothetical protein
MEKEHREPKGEPKTRVERILEYTRHLVSQEEIFKAKEVMERLLQDDTTYELRGYILAMREDEREQLIGLIKGEIERARKALEDEKLEQTFSQNKPEQESQEPAGSATQS